ncbi:Dihydroneopterin aldolase (FolB) (PDB:1B9L) [Commensalibacter communis]|uniref:dihydroneopterin aldolase n=1 Tax=Commensalibacter communis TaxID=2972786 RepID=UPI0022FFA352|nr:dihydroneopterin aldolase [Commensalibacter communis]CAI3945067.1 Dihydroneopterin aldolase (FolB) (PDB:1B9L) [Commensalibacter communis]
MSFFPAWSNRPPLRRIFIKNLILQARIGVYDFEQETTQRLQINISVGVIEDKGIGIDDLARTVSYEDITNQVKTIVSHTHFHLVETLAETIIETILEDKRIHVARVTLEKLDIISEAQGVGVEIERWNVEMVSSAI